MQESPAAPVARQLLAFLDEPARHRVRFLTGAAPMPPGPLVLRFAQGKFPGDLLRELQPRERERVQEAAIAFIREVCLSEGATHYQVLCLPPGASRDAIKESYHLFMALIHPDRQDAPGPWPTGSAQRVNSAYAVLSDAALRHAYDADLRRIHMGTTIPPHAAGPRPAARHQRTRRARKTPGLRIARALFAVIAVTASLLLLEVWVSDMSGARSILDSALLGHTSRADRGGTERPRFMDGRAALPRERAPDLTPEPRKIEPPAVTASRADTRRAPAVEATPVPVAPAPAPRPARTPQGATLAQSQEPSPSTETRLTTADIENLVVRLVGYYEAGEADKLMALLDPAEGGFWRTAQARQAYHDFFRATRNRRLRVDRLAWQTAQLSARAKGEATVVAEYFDEPGARERKVDVEMDIALRDGHARITRLSLFPNAP